MRGVGELRVDLLAPGAALGTASPSSRGWSRRALPPVLVPLCTHRPPSPRANPRGTTANRQGFFWVPLPCAQALPSERRDALLRAHTSFYMSFLSSWIKSRAAKLPVLCHVTLIASRSHHILNSCGFSEAIYLMQFAKCLRSSADSDILGLQSFAI